MYARRIPKTILNCVRATRNPRLFGGAISAVYSGETTEAPPTPIPPRKRKKTKDYQSHGKALPIAETR